jgi:N-acetylglutamate synthase-like GNAT family acetyltransferase
MSKESKEVLIKSNFQVEKDSPGFSLSRVIADWIRKEAEKGLMLPKDPKEIAQKLSVGMALVALKDDKEPVGYCELLEWTPHVVEVGGLIVKPEERRQGIGSSLALAAARLARTRFPKATIFCLAENEISQELFQELGGRIFRKKSLPDSVWSICPDCAHYSEFPDGCPCRAINLEGLL